MLALIPLAISLAPELINWAFGDSAGKTAAAVATVVQSVTGTSDPAAVSALIASDPAKSTELRMELAKIAAAAAADARAADLDTMRAEFANTAGARAQTIDLLKSGSRMAWGAPVVSLVVLTVFAAGFFMVFRMAPGEATSVQIGMVEILKAAAISVVSYWVGSSSSAARSTELLARSPAIS